MSSCIEQNTFRIQPEHFVKSVKAVFSTMVGCDLVLGEVTSKNNLTSRHELRGIIGFSGSVQGTIVVSLDRDVAFATCEAFLGCKPTCIDADVMDLVRELANMIAGGARERIGDCTVNMGLPTAVAGTDHMVSFDPTVKVFHLPFTSPWGGLTVEYGVRDERPIPQG